MYGVDQMYCMSRRNYSLTGDYFSKEFSYISFKLTKCEPTPTKKCKNQTEIDNFFSALTLNVAFVN